MSTFFCDGYETPCCLRLNFGSTLTEAQGDIPQVTNRYLQESIPTSAVEHIWVSKSPSPSEQKVLTIHAKRECRSIKQASKQASNPTHPSMLPPPPSQSPTLHLTATTEGNYSAMSSRPSHLPQAQDSPQRPEFHPRLPHARSPRGEKKTAEHATQRARSGWTGPPSSDPHVVLPALTYLPHRLPGPQELSPRPPFELR